MVYSFRGVISQGEALIQGSDHFDLTLGSMGSFTLQWELVDKENCRLTPSDRLEVAHLGNPHFALVTPQVLLDAKYSREPIIGSLTGTGRISSGSVIAATGGKLLAKIRINSIADTMLSVSWVSYWMVEGTE